MHGALLVLLQATGEQFTERRAELLDLGQVGGAILDDQPVDFGVGHCGAIRTVQDHLGRRCDLVPGQRLGEVGEGQVGRQHGFVAAQAGQCGASFAGGEEHIGLGGDLLAIGDCAVVPGAGTRIEGLLEILPATDPLQVCIEILRLGNRPRFTATIYGPDLISSIGRGIEALLECVGAQRTDHEKVAIFVTEVERSQLGVVTQSLGEGRQQIHAPVGVAGLILLIQNQQAEQVANRLIGMLQVGLDLLADLLEQLITAGENDFAGLMVIENTQHHACAK